MSSDSARRRTPRTPHPSLLLWTVAVLGCGMPSDGRPCVSAHSTRTAPLLVGDTATLVVGSMLNSDCLVPSEHAARWESTDSAVVRIDPQGRLTGLRPGVFTARASVDTVTLEHEGFVLPSGWRMAVLPESVTVSVGDTAWFEVVALDAAGQRLPAVYASIFTDAFDRILRDSIYPPSPPVDMWSRQWVRGPARFIAQRPGVVRLRAQVGPQERTAVLHITPAP